MRISDWSSDVCSSDLDALAVSGQGAQAYGMLGPMRQPQALPEARLSELETRWAEAPLHEAEDANVLAARWETLPKPLKSEPRVVNAYAHRAADLRPADADARSTQHATHPATAAARRPALRP